MNYVNYIKMEGNLSNDVKFEIREKAGVRDWILNNFYDLSIFTDGFGTLTKITLYCDEEYILGLEYFYDNISTGIFSGKDFILKEQIKKITVQLSEKDYIQSVHGSFNNDFITELIFCLSSGEHLGFSNTNSNTKTNTKYFKFYQPENELFALKLAFGKYLTFISPIFKQLNPKKLIKNYGNFLDNEIMMLTTLDYGKIFDDSKLFNYENEYQQFGKITRVDLYHDKSLVTGIKLKYEKKDVTYCLNTNSENILCESLVLDHEKGEEIVSISIRSGDMIDNLTLHTNKNNSISAGGHGGGLHTLHLAEIRRENPEMRFCGFSGAYKNNMHSLKIIFLNK